MLATRVRWHGDHLDNGIIALVATCAVCAPEQKKEEDAGQYEDRGGMYESALIQATESCLEI